MQTYFKRACLLSLFLMACSSDTSTGNDAGPDGTVVDAPSDTSTQDAAKDASADGPLDALADATNDDASDGAIDDASNDATPDVQDAAVDADDASAIDGGVFDAGASDAGKKGCTGVFCIIGDTCCNNMASVDYGKCEPTSCKTCCK